MKTRAFDQLVQDMLEELDPQERQYVGPSTRKDEGAAPAVSFPAPAVFFNPAADAPEAPSEQEYLQAWAETIYPDFSPDETYPYTPELPRSGARW